MCECRRRTVEDFQNRASWSLRLTAGVDQFGEGRVNGLQGANASPHIYALVLGQRTRLQQILPWGVPQATEFPRFVEREAQLLCVLDESNQGDGVGGNSPDIRSQPASAVRLSVRHSRGPSRLRWFIPSGVPKPQRTRAFTCVELRWSC